LCVAKKARDKEFVEGFFTEGLQFIEKAVGKGL